MNGINFIQPLFHAVVEGRKTMTRRIVKPQPYGFDHGYPYYRYNKITDTVIRSKIIKPRYKVGETVYLKEPYLLDDDNDFGATVKRKYSKSELEISWVEVQTELKASNNKMDEIINSIFRRQEKSEWLNSQSMPEWCAEHFIEITGVKVERLKSISDKDCLKEGVKEGTMGYFYVDDIKGCFDFPQNAFAALIDKIKRGTWDSNPFVFCYEFKLVK